MTQAERERAMDGRCKVSILCTAYNHEEYIREALESFVAQETDFEYEILVNDDCSTDGTAEIIREFAQRYPDKLRPFYQKENLYSKGGMPFLFESVFFPNARGEYFALCEGDDYWTDARKLQMQVDFLDAHGDYSGCVHNTRLHYCDASAPDAPLRPEGEGDRDVAFETVIHGPSKSFHTSSILARREFILDPPDYHLVAARHGFTDYAIGIRLTLGGRLRFIDRCMSVYRISSNPAAWSAKLDRHYARLKEFVTGEIAMMQTLLPQLDGDKRALTQRVIIEREYELNYIMGRVELLTRPPYDEIFKEKPFKTRLGIRLKQLFPHLHRLYRRHCGYEDY